MTGKNNFLAWIPVARLWYIGKLLNVEPKKIYSMFGIWALSAIAGFVLNFTDFGKSLGLMQYIIDAFLVPFFMYTPAFVIGIAFDYNRDYKPPKKK